MNLRRVVFASVIGIALVWFFWPREDDSSSNQRSTNPKMKKAVQKPVATQQEKNLTAQAQPNKPKPPTRPKEPSKEIKKAAESQAQLEASEDSKPIQLAPGEVEFEVIDGKAVAFGDTIIGGADPKFNGKRGVHRPEKSKLWPSPQIPYAIAKDLPNPQRVQNAITYFHENTPIRFVPFEGQKDVIVFVQGKELCLSHLGRVGGQQPIYLSENCGTQEILHEIMHALGFVHEQSRTDRDRFVEIQWDNIPKERYIQFAMVPEDWVHEYRGSVFDFNYQSIMLYQDNAFAVQPNQKTMVSRTRQEIQPSQNGLSKIDLERIYYLYGL